jgi:hypothetical protein
MMPKSPEFRPVPKKTLAPDSVEALFDRLLRQGQRESSSEAQRRRERRAQLQRNAENS